MVDKAYLFNDEQMRHFIANGYVTLKTDFPATFHEAIYQKIEAVMEKEGNVGNNILPRIPEMQEVFDQPVVRGALTSVLGPDYIMHPHRHCHHNRPGSEAQRWHKDSYWGYRQVRHHRPRWAMAFYYPQDVSPEIGPSAIMPGTQYYTTRTNDDTEVELPVLGEAGTVTIIHYDLWHKAKANRTDKNRYMLKFQFTRMAEYPHPTWDNQREVWTPIENGAPANKHQVMWRHIWNWLSGNGTAAGSGASSSANGSVSRLIDALRDGNQPARLNAADELGLIGESAQEAMPALTDALGNASEPVGLNAAYALGELGAPAVPALIAASNSESELACGNAVYALSAVGAPAIPALIAALSHESEAVRRGAACALGEIGPSAQDAVPALTKVLGDTSESVRLNAAEALGLIGRPAQEIVPALVRALRDTDGQVRFSAVLSLARIGAEAQDAIPALKNALKDENRYVRGYAVEALQRIGTPEAKDALFSFLMTSRWCPLTTRESTF